MQQVAVAQVEVVGDVLFLEVGDNGAVGFAEGGKSMPWGKFQKDSSLGDGLIVAGAERIVAVFQFWVALVELVQRIPVPLVDGGGLDGLEILALVVPAGGKALALGQEVDDCWTRPLLGIVFLEDTLGKEGKTAFGPGQAVARAQADGLHVLLDVQPGLRPKGAVGLQGGFQVLVHSWIIGWMGFFTFNFLLSTLNFSLFNYCLLLANQPAQVLSAEGKVAG